MCQRIQDPCWKRPSGRPKDATNQAKGFTTKQLGDPGRPRSRLRGLQDNVSLLLPSPGPRLRIVVCDMSRPLFTPRVLGRRDFTIRSTQLRRPGKERQHRPIMTGRGSHSHTALGRLRNSPGVPGDPERASQGPRAQSTRPTSSTNYVPLIR